VDGPIAAVAGVRPDEVTYPPGAEALPGVWLEARGMLRSVLETTTFADLVERSRVLAGQGDRRAPRTPAPARTRPNHR
jgi:DNA-binding IscR family transcriptional regulator